MTTRRPISPELAAIPVLDGPFRQAIRPDRRPLLDDACRRAGQYLQQVLAARRLKLRRHAAMPTARLRQSSGGTFCLRGWTPVKYNQCASVSADSGRMRIAPTTRAVAPRSSDSVCCHSFRWRAINPGSHVTQ
jgi:hypothetical protein